jgi:hypothetical protein
MTDMILTLGQDTVRDDINQFILMSKSGARPEQLNEVWRGILALIEEDPSEYPVELHPRVFFKGRTVLGRRGARPLVKVYLHKLAKWIDANKSTNLPR